MRVTLLLFATIFLLISCDVQKADYQHAIRVIRPGQIIGYEATTCPVMSMPDDASTRLIELRPHTTVLVTDSTAKGWTLIKYGPNKAEGFVQTTDITPAKFAHPVRIKGKQIVLRGSPTIYHPAIAKLKSTDSLDIISNADDKWVFVCSKDGTVGFVEKRFLTTH